MDPTRLSEGSVNIGEKVKLRSKDGMVVEADVKAMMAQSRVLKNLIEECGTDEIIPVPNLSGSTLRSVVDWCGEAYELGLDPYWCDRIPDVVIVNVSDTLKWKDLETPEHDRFQREIGVNVLDADLVDAPYVLKLNDQETLDHERFQREVFGPNFVNKFCSKFDWGTIKGLHEAAKYLDIPSLLQFTSTLIREAPSRAFMGVVSSWVDYDSMEAYCKYEVTAF